MSIHIQDYSEVIKIKIKLFTDKEWQVYISLNSTPWLKKDHLSVAKIFGLNSL